MKLRYEKNKRIMAKSKNGMILKSKREKNQRIGEKVKRKE